MTKGRETLHRLLEAAGGIPDSVPPTPIDTERHNDIESVITGLEEVNLFEGLGTGQ
jgi:hypothetical protein